MAPTCLISIAFYIGMTCCPQCKRDAFPSIRVRTGRHCQSARSSGEQQRHDFTEYVSVVRLFCEINCPARELKSTLLNRLVLPLGSEKVADCRVICLVRSSLRDIHSNFKLAKEQKILVRSKD